MAQLLYGNGLGWVPQLSEESCVRSRSDRVNLSPRTKGVPRLWFSWFFGKVRKVVERIFLRVPSLLVFWESTKSFLKTRDGEAKKPFYGSCAGDHDRDYDYD
jgi:hypothetical protein